MQMWKKSEILIKRIEMFRTEMAHVCQKIGLFLV